MNSNHQRTNSIQYPSRSMNAIASNHIQTEQQEALFIGDPMQQHCVDHIACKAAENKINLKTVKNT